MGISPSNTDNETYVVRCTPDYKILKKLDNLLSGKNDGFFITGEDVGELKKLLKKSDMLKHGCGADGKIDNNFQVPASGSVMNTKMLRNAITVYVFDPRPSEATNMFFTAFKQMLQLRCGIIAEKISKFNDGEAPIIVICNLASRLEADIDRTLSSVRKTDYSRVVLLALHVKPKHALQQERTKEKLSLYEEKYRDLGGVVDFAFTGEDGFYNCKTNDFAFSEIHRLFTETKRQRKENVYEEPSRSNTPPLIDPWRDIKGDWTSSFSETLLSEIQMDQTGSDEVKSLGLLLLGPISAGKSSFINSICSIGKGRIVNKAYTGFDAKSYTTSFTTFKGVGFLNNFRLCDTMGLEDGNSEGFDVGYIVNLIEGHIRSTYQFNPRHLLTFEDPAYEPRPKAKDKIHCVIFVIDASLLGSGLITNDMKKKINCLQDEIKKRIIQRVFILTKIDLLCEKVHGDIRNTFKSTKVQRAVKLASEIFGIPEFNIHPVKNYVAEIDIDPIINIPLLLALRQIIHSATYFLEDDDEKFDCGISMPF